MYLLGAAELPDLRGQGPPALENDIINKRPRKDKRACKLLRAFLFKL